MNNERNVLAACLKSRAAHDKVAKHLAREDLGEQGALVLGHITDYYDADPDATMCDTGIVGRAIERSLSNPKHRETFDRIMQDLSEAEVSPANVVRDILGVKMAATGAKLASALAAGRSYEEVAPVLEEYDSYGKGATLVDSADERVYRGESVADLVRTSYGEGGLMELWPKSLNSRLDGGCLPGHHVVVFARPEAGKTLFLVNMIAGFLNQDLPCLYVGNEDPIQDIVLRVVSRLTGKTKYEVLENPDEADALARERGYNNLVLAGMAPGSPREIEALIAEWQPRVVLIDQLRNLNVGEEHFVQKMEKAATAARNIAKKHNVLVVSVTQAGDSASGKAVLDMGDVDSSNTGIPAQADVMIGIGGTAEDFAYDRRVISLPKNKRSGKHEFFTVQLLPGLSKVRNLE